MQQREILAKTPRVFGALKSNQPLVKAVALPIALRLMPITGMSRQAEHKFVMTPILVRLIAIVTGSAVLTRLNPGRAD